MDKEPPINSSERDKEYPQDIIRRYVTELADTTGAPDSGVIRHGTYMIDDAATSDYVIVSVAEHDIGQLFIETSIDFLPDTLYSITVENTHWKEGSSGTSGVAVVSQEMLVASGGTDGIVTLRHGDEVTDLSDESMREASLGLVSAFMVRHRLDEIIRRPSEFKHLPRS